MKILGPLPEGIKEFPTRLLNEYHAQLIHSQSLKRLNERGGMSYGEIVINIFTLEIRDIEHDEIKHEKLLRHILECIKIN